MKKLWLVSVLFANRRVSCGGVPKPGWKLSVRNDKLCVWHPGRMLMVK